MTFTELVDEVLARTRQTSAEARDRIGRAINDRHRRITSSVGLQTSRRTTVYVVLLGGPPTLPSPTTAPVAVDIGTGTFSDGRIYRVCWATLVHADLVVARSAPGPVGFFVPSGTGAGARVTAPTPIPPSATHWELEAAATTGGFYRIARLFAPAVTTYDDTLPATSIPLYGVLTSDTGGTPSHLVAMPPLAKVESVHDPTRRRMLSEVTFDEWRTRATTSPITGPPDVYAIDTMTATDVALRVHPWPDTDYTLTVDGLAIRSDLTANLLPLFSADFHDVLMHGALSDEWLQLKQDDLSRRSEAMYEQRLAELRLFIAKSAYLDIYQGKRGTESGGAYWPGARYRGRY